METVKPGRLTLISNETSNSVNMAEMIHALRTGLWFILLLGCLVFQLAQNEFLNTSVWVPVFFWLFIVFGVNSLHLFFMDFEKSRPWGDLGLFLVDAVGVSALIYYMEAYTSFFPVLYLITILFSGILLERAKMAFVVLVTSCLYSLNLAASSGQAEQSILFYLILNNAAFAGTGYLSSLFGEQVRTLGFQLTASDKKVKNLTEVNSLIVSNIASGLLTLNSNLKVTLANRAAEKILEDKSLSGLSLVQIFPEVFREIQGGGIANSRGSLRRMEVEFEAAGGSEKIIEALVSALMDDEGENQGYIVLFQDLTEVKHLEKQLRQSDKLAAVGQLAAGIAHEIRNPLASISGSIQLLVTNPEALKEDDLKLMRIVLREIDRLNNLINEFLEFVRPEVHATDSVSLSELIKEVLEMVRFNKNLPEDVVQKSNLAARIEIAGHRDKLKQALLNIVINAYQAMADSDTREISVETLDENEGVILIIRDTGSGMEEKTLNRIFEPFLTTKPKGTGLGLAITHKILESHGAIIDVTSAVGEGTEFRIEFPGGGPRKAKEVAQQKQA